MQLNFLLYELCGYTQSTRSGRIIITVTMNKTSHMVCYLTLIIWISSTVFILVNGFEGNIRSKQKPQKLPESIVYRKNVHTCTKNQSTTWCIPMNYDKYGEAWKFGHLTNSSFPWNYRFKFQIFDVQEVNDHMQTITLNMYFRITWLEPRLKITTNSKDWNNPELGPPDEINVSPEILKHLWYPDLEIYGVEEFTTKHILKAQSGLQILKNRSIRFNARVDIKFSCQMNFDRYPLDSHHCPFRIGSYYGTEGTITCTSEYAYDNERQRSLQYFIDIEKLPQKYETYVIDERRYSICGVNILLNRTKMQILFQVYLTSTLLAIISWVSFIIKPDVVPGRMGLLVTIFLVLINIFISVNSSAPVSTSLNAVDLYLVICIGQVFFALIEYAIVLFMESNSRQDISSQGETTNRISSPPGDTMTGTRKAWIKPERHTSRNRLDSLSLIVFPIFFICFNMIYWMGYLHI